MHIIHRGNEVPLVQAVGRDLFRVILLYIYINWDTSGHISSSHVWCIHCVLYPLLGKYLMLEELRWDTIGSATIRCTFWFSQGRFYSSENSLPKTILRLTNDFRELWAFQDSTVCLAKPDDASNGHFAVLNWKCDIMRTLLIADI